MSHVVWTAALLGIALLLLAMALLQYRWNMQIRRATEIRVGADLESAMMKWHLDLYGELSTICIGLQVGPDSGANDRWDDYLRRYVEWRRVATSSTFVENIYSNPDVVSDIYIWETSAQAKPKLLRLNPDAENLENSSAPKELDTLLPRLQANSSNLSLSLRTWEFRSSSENEHAARGNQISSSSFGLRSNALAGWQFDQNIPAIVHPLVHHAHPFDANTPVNRRAVDWLVVVLNFSAVRNRILPELAIRHFGGRDGLEYKLAVVARGNRPSLIYSSDPAFRIGDVGNFDSSIKIFASPPADGEGGYWQTVTRSRTLQGEEWRNFSAPVWFPVIQYTSQDEPWVLIVQHATGMTPIARSILHRDLITGGVVLVLLAGNMGLVVFASHRAHKFAKIQMEFVASVSHELRTPLAAIFSAGENIKDGFVEGRENLKFYGFLITSQARQLIELVDRILLYASTRSGKTQYVLRPLMVSEILQAVRKNTAELLEAAGFTLEQHIEPGLPCVLADHSAVCACLQNLIINAVKYGGADRWIGVSATGNKADKNTREIRISVQDHGNGISSSELPFIFEPFYRSPKVVAAQIHGTGLGLPLAKHFAEALGGRVTVASEVGVGSVFTLHLPVADEQDSRLAIASSGNDMVMKNE
jgi:signal transduction histidine kinase